MSHISCEGGAVTIAGCGFDNPVVEVDGVPRPVVAYDCTQIMFTEPPDGCGTVTITVYNAADPTDTDTLAYDLAITAVSQAPCEGGLATIDGCGFDQSGGITLVVDGVDRTADILSVSCNQIEFNAPASDQDLPIDIYNNSDPAHNAMASLIYDCGPPDVVLRIEPTAISGGCDTEQLTITVVIEDVAYLHNVNFDLTFDPSVLQASGCVEGPFLGQVCPTVFFPDIDNSSGTVNVANVILGSCEGTGGCGVVANCTFDVLDWEALPTALCLENMILEDNSGASIPSAPECGMVTDPRKGDVDASGYIDYVDLFDFAFEWHMGCVDEGYCSINDYNDDCYIDYNDLFDFVFDWHTGAHLTAPDGGEVCTGLEEVTWDAGSMTDEALSIDLYASMDDGACWQQIAAGEVDDGSYMWDTTGWPNSSECKVKLVAYNSTDMYEDESDGMFTINNVQGIAGLSSFVYETKTEPTTLSGGPIDDSKSVEAIASFSAKKPKKEFRIAAMRELSRPSRAPLRISPSMIRKARRTGEIEVLIKARRVKDLHDVSFDLGFDPEAVRVISCEEGDVLGTAGQTIFLPDIDNTTGKLNIAAALLGTGNGATGSGTIARIIVVIKNPELLPVELFLDNVILQDSQGAGIR